MMTPRPELTLVIPVKDDEITLARLEDRFVNFAPGAEIVFVDDASRDRSLSYLRSIAARDARFRVISLARSVGRNCAIAAGLDHARGRAVISMGLEHPAETIQALVEKWREGYDVVYARSFLRPADGFFTRAPARIYDQLLADLVPIGTTLDTGDLRLVSRRVVKRLRRMPDRHRPGMPAWVGFRQASIEHESAGAQRSFGKLLRTGVEAILTFSDVPLRFALYVGFILFGVVGVLLLVTIITTFTRTGHPPWIANAIMITFFSSLNLVAVGTLGGYVARIAEASRRRPLYITAEKIGFGRFRPRAPTHDFASGGQVEVSAAPPVPSRPPPAAFPSAPTPMPAPPMVTAPMAQAAIPPPTPSAPPSAFAPTQPHPQMPAPPFPSRPPPNVVASPGPAPAPSALGSKPPPGLPSRTKTMMGTAAPAAPKPVARPMQPPTMAGLGLPAMTASSSPPPLVVPVPPPPSSSLKVAVPAPPSSDPPDDAWESTEAHSSQPHTVVSPPQSRMTEPDAVVEKDDDVEKTSEEEEEVEKAPDSTPTAVTNSAVPPNAIRPPFESRVEDDEDSVTRVGPPPSTQKD